jgi:hypothetical protein
MRGGEERRKPSERRGLESAVVYGHATAPAWIKYIDIAKRLFTQPWKLVGGSKTLWIIRTDAIREMEAKAMMRQRNRASSTEEIDARLRRKR